MHRALTTQAMCPEALNRRREARVREQQPEAKHRLGQQVHDGQGDDLGIHAPLAGTITNRPDDRVQRPDDDREARNRRIQLRDLPVLIHHRAPAGQHELVHDDQVRHARHGVPAPALPIGVRAREEQSRQDHDGIGEQGDEDVGAVNAGDEGEGEQREGRGEDPVNPAHPEDLAEDMERGVGDVVLVAVDDEAVDEGVAGAGGLGEVGEGGDGGDEG
jgi:hypothetical protein